MNKNFFFKLFLPASIFPLAAVFSLQAQDSSLLRKNLMKDFVFKGNHIRFDFSPLSTFRAQIKKQTGSYPVSTAAAPGVLLSLKYQVNFNNCYSLITGPEAIVAGRNILVSFDKDDFSPPLVMNYTLRNKETYIENLILGLPVLLEKRILYSDTKYFFINGGARLNFSAGADFESFSILLMHTDNGYYNVGGTDVIANNDARPWMSFPINAGHSWLLKSNNLLQILVTSNISFTKYVDGIYQIIIPGQPITEGKYSSTGSYIGLSISYLFTSANYRIRKAYEKMKSRETKKPH